MTVNSNSALSPASLIAQAFKCDDVAATKTTTGIQTMAAAIFAAHSERESRRPQFDAYASKGDAYTVFKAEIVASHIAKRMKQADGKPDDVARANTANATQMVLLNKGFDLAFALNACGVSLASFVPSANGGTFSVPAKSLVSNDDSLLGALSKANETGKLIPLNGATYSCLHNEKVTQIKAFPARVLEVAGYKKAGKVTAPVTAPVSNGASDTSTSGSATAEEVKANPATWSFDALLTNAAALILKAHDIAKEGEAVSWSSLSDETRNAIEGLLIFRDECKAVDAMTKQVKAA